MRTEGTGYIYGIRLKGCEKIFYVGQTRQKVRARARSHFRGRAPVAEALRLLGTFDDFEFVTLETLPYAALNSREVCWINELGTLHPNGMNQCGGASIHVHGEQARRKLSVIMKTRCAEPAFKEAQRKRNKKLWQDPEYRKRQAEGRALVTGTDEFRAKISARKKEMWSEPTRKAEMSDKVKAHWRDPELRALRIERISDAQSTPERKKQQSEISKAMWRDPVRREAILRRQAEARAAKMRQRTDLAI